MNEKITSIDSNISNSHNIKLFAKTTTSNFMKSYEKTPKENKDFYMTKSTMFSDNHLTNTIASSIRTISKIKSIKKEKPLFLNLEDFHKQFILNKNKYNNKLSALYTQNGYNSNKSKKKLTLNSSKNNVIKLIKKSKNPSFLISSSKKSRNKSIINKYNLKNKEYLTSTNFFSVYDNKSRNRDLFLRGLTTSFKCQKRNKANNYSNYNSKEYPRNNISNNIFCSRQKLNQNEVFILKTQRLKEPNYEIKNIDKNFLNIKVNNNSNSNKNIIYYSNDNKKIKNQDRLLKYYIGRSPISVNELLAYPSFNSYLSARGNRYENIRQFIYKTRMMIFDKYIENINKNSYFKLISKNENNLENLTLIRKRIELTVKLFTIYNKTLEEYIRYVLRKLREIREENEILEQNIIQIKKDIEKEKQKIKKDLNIIKEGYSIKFFLMCVKNQTICLEKFEKEDFEIIENDRLKLNEYYYSPKSNVTIKERKNSKLNTIFINNKMKRFSSNSSEKIPFDTLPKFENNKKDVGRSSLFIPNNKIKKTCPTVFNSVEEFFEYLDSIALKINILIKESNDICANNIYLKLQLENNIKYEENQAKLSDMLDDKIKINQNILENLKNKNKIIYTKLNKLKDNKFKNDVKIILVLKNIYKIYNNIKKHYSSITLIKKDDVILFGYQIYLKIIEDFYLKITNKVLEDKRANPIKYEKLKQQIEKRKKEDAFIQFQRLLLQKIEITIDKVLKKASKAIYRRTGKANDYREYSRSIGVVKKKEKKKTKMDLFFEYLDDIED